MIHKSNIPALTCLFVLIACQLSCYSFKGISIPEAVDTFYLAELTKRAPNAPADIGQTFSEFFKQKLLNETKLTFDDVNSDVDFVGEVTRYDVSSVAPQPGETTAFNRLTIAIRMDYISNLDEEDNWQSSFSFYSDYSRDDNLLDIQDELIQTIFTQIGEDIFNKAFTNW